MSEKELSINSDLEYCADQIRESIRKNIAPLDEQVKDLMLNAVRLKEVLYPGIDWSLFEFQLEQDKEDPAKINFYLVPLVPLVNVFGGENE